MNLRNVLWIWQREIRDQFRDRRTLFMVAVLPVLMYPLLGTSMFQLAQFMRQTTGKVAIYGADELRDVEGLPALVDGDRFAADLFIDPEERGRLKVEERSAPAGERLAMAEAAVAGGEIDAAICFPDDFAEGVERSREAETTDAAAVAPPQPAVRFNSSRESSQLAGLRVTSLLRRWSDAVVAGNLRARNVPIAATQPFSVDQVDVAPKESRNAQLWAKLLPFIVFLWALTGAFYPAIDLCAGEKERGTLETLLASPARRSEIVGGKLLTVMTFSIFTALLNLASLALTAKVLMGQLAGMAGLGAAFAPPPVSAMLWLVVAVLPMSALFSALSLACAAYARSTKEGQYYFMPLFLAATPLMLMPTAPGVELNLGNSLVPVMGLVLLLRATIEGQVAQAALYLAPVIAVTAVCCWLAMRWAVSQFNQESVLFRESERFSPKAQLAAMVRRRGETPSAAAAMACVAGIFLLRSLLTPLMPAPIQGESGFGYLAVLTILSQLQILAPALAVAWLLTRDPLRSLLLKGPVRGRDIAVAALAALCLIPLSERLKTGIQGLYPLPEGVEAQLGEVSRWITDSPSIALTVLLLAVLPAVCEELAFRGVVLSGLRKSLGDLGGVLMTAVFFGAAHTVLQQSLAAAPVGFLLGLIAVRTGSLIPCVVFHAVYNALQLVSALNAEAIRNVAASWGVHDMVFIEMPAEQLGYATPFAILGGVAAAGLIWALGSHDRGKPQVAARLGTAS
ncbi:ABC transporter permease subunit/CPBP intramembrane protease [Botrimarina mediterranea]|uniref:ABC-2 family transporter protein n=1 Tax=Botrimarina mediterranea TaxID=2528022 RepID=A0A518K9X8_9BACT|nr:ABC transporter permease subunit/CPBP intramembrane protease [Botrimarina mediterranea]QDV74590.1 ABC-2 family transporter protein [Botrimarina mediterranea]QDV79229.1 ABC-2 family transporter protein [Planctomycetes bacterium K2D]